jgi:hypothetical protein
MQFHTTLALRRRIAAVLASDASEIQSREAYFFSSSGLLETRLLETAKQMKVFPSLMERLGLHPLLVQQRKARTEQLLRDVAQLSAHFDKPRFVVVEHASNFFRFSLPLGLYDSGDIDLLSTPVHVRDIEKQLTAMGYSRVPDGQEFLRRTFRRATEHGDDLEITVWLRPLARNRLPEPRFLSSAQILEFAENVDSAWGVIPLMPVTMDLVYHCLHASLHAFVLPPGLRIYLDIDRACTFGELDWNYVFEFCELYKTGARVETALQIAKSVLKTDVPDEILASLAPYGVGSRAFVATASKLALFPEIGGRYTRISILLSEGFARARQLWRR